MRPPHGGHVLPPPQRGRRPARLERLEHLATMANQTAKGIRLRERYKSARIRLVALAHTVKLFDPSGTEPARCKEKLERIATIHAERRKAFEQPLKDSLASGLDSLR